MIPYRMVQFYVNLDRSEVSEIQIGVGVIALKVFGLGIH